MKILITSAVFLILFTCSPLVAQVFPHDGDALHYRLIGFSFPKQEKATRYTLEVAEYHTGKDGNTETKKLFEKTDTTNRIIATVPSFGKKYMWRVKYLKKNRVIHTTRYYYFSTKPNPFSDTSVTRVVILDSASMYKDMLVFFDNTRTLYNMNGEAVWFLPEIEGATNNHITGIRDLKMTGDGTITFLTDNNVFEIDYHGNVLWRGPNDGTVSGDSTERYHHQFDKLPGGGYMVAGANFVMRRIPAYVDTNVYKGRATEVRDDGRYTLISCGTLIEYDSNGSVVWSWNNCEHLDDADIFTPSGNMQIRPSTHLNGFWLDKEKQVVYTSHRDISRIIKAEYPSGQVLSHYGEDYTHDGRIQGDGLFYSQHNCRLGKDGHLYLFNNNVKRREAGHDSR
ncbi:MAG: aryl-sulfate sulfotransferase, partial [Taibaiella sp.]|nr:aryl-sulfate sulfotransferase [Taibaiella sp.]